LNHDENTSTIFSLCKPPTDAIFLFVVASGIFVVGGSIVDDNDDDDGIVLAT